MKINTISRSYNFTHFFKKKSKKEKELAIAQNNSIQKSVDFDNLSSKYDINKKQEISLQQIQAMNDKEFDEFLDLQAEAIEKIFLDTFDKYKNFKTNSLISSSDDVEYLNNEFINDEISSIFRSGVSLNLALNYLAVKKQISLLKNSPNIAFVLDEFSLEYLKRTKDENFYNLLNEKRIKIYYPKNLSQSIIDEFVLLTEANPEEFKCLNLPSDENKKDNFPNKNEIKETIKHLAKMKFPNDIDKQREFIFISAKFLINQLIFAPYKKLSFALRQVYKNIENTLKKENKNMDDILFFVFAKGKSYDLINYIFAKENNIPFEKFVYFEDSSNPPDLKADKIYVILDDVSISGTSLFIAQDSINSVCPQAKTIIAPVFMNQQACKKTSYRKNAFCPYQILDEGKGLSNEELDYLVNNSANDTNEFCFSVILPYMIQDYTSDLVMLLSRFCQNHNSYFSNNFLRENKNWKQYEKLIQDISNSLAQQKG